MRPRIRCRVAMTVAMAWAAASGGAADAPLLPGFVKGDVVSYSYVPIRTWRPDEAIGTLPYLFEYLLMAHSDTLPLEHFHEENIRRIDIASSWSTAIMLYPRHARWRDEIINLMLRCYRNRQLIVMRDYHNRHDDETPPYHNLRAILDVLWEKRDATLTSPEGDTATGRQLINNILANKLGDEGLAGLGTGGLGQLYADFNNFVRFRTRDGTKPFRHIKGWYNLIGYAALDYNGAYAASRDDVDIHGRHMLPANTHCIGVDVYHYWGHSWSPFDPADLSISRARVRAHTDEWHRLRTRYYPEGLKVKVCRDSHDPATWVPACWNDTHALLQALELAGADNAMMWYIGVTGQLDDSEGPPTYTTPVETMDAYYDTLKAGPWSGLCWWTFGTFKSCRGGLEYYDKTLLHHTPAHPEGVPYSDAMLQYWHDAFMQSRMRMFNDVVYSQFGHVNPRPAPAPPSVD